MSLEAFLHARDALLGARCDQRRACETFRWPELEHFNWGLDWFDRVPPRDRVALHIVWDNGDELRLTFGELTRRSNQVANGLRALGVGRGDRVLLMLGNVASLWETMLAAMKLGAVIVPTSTLLPPDDLADRLARGRVRAVVAASDLAARFDGLRAAEVRVAVGGTHGAWHRYEAFDREPETFVPDGLTRADDPLLLYFTSGTTQRPKLVEHTHQSYPVGHLSTMYWLGLRPGDVHMNVSSPGWAKHAWSCFFAPWNAEATVFVLNQSRFHAKQMLEVLEHHRVTSLCAPPTVWRMLILEDLAAHRMSLRELAGAGEPLNPEVIARVHAAWGLTLRDGFGQTETTLQIGNPPGELVKPGSMGRAMPGYTVVLLDPDGVPGDEGELCLDLSSRPAGLMTGYADDPERSAEATRGGYYRTGDVATRDADGYITYVGRTDDVFKASDYRISPFELESVLIEHPAVVEAAVVPSPDPLRLAVPKAFVTLAAGHAPDAATARDLLAFCRDHLAPYKRVRRVEFAELPKTISGKIRRVDLRRRELARAEGAARNAFEWWEDDFPELKGSVVTPQGGS